MQFLSDELDRRQDLVEAVASLQNLAISVGLTALENIPVDVHPEVNEPFRSKFAEIAAAMYNITEPWQARH